LGRSNVRLAEGAKYKITEFDGKIRKLVIYLVEIKDPAPIAYP